MTCRPPAFYHRWHRYSLALAGHAPEIEVSEAATMLEITTEVQTHPHEYSVKSLLTGVTYALNHPTIVLIRL